MPPILVLLAIIALVLYIVFDYLMPPISSGPAYWRSLLAFIIVILILLFWYVIPIHVG